MLPIYGDMLVEHDMFSFLNSYQKIQLNIFSVVVFMSFFIFDIRSVGSPLVVFWLIKNTEKGRCSVCAHQLSSTLPKLSLNHSEKWWFSGSVVANIRLKLWVKILGTTEPLNN